MLEFGNVIVDAIQCMRNEKIIYKDYIPEEAIITGENLQKSTQNLGEDVLDKVVVMLKDEIPKQYPYPTVYWYSVLVNLKKDPGILKEFIEYILKKKEAFSTNTLYFLYYQLKSLVFRFSSSLERYDTKELLWKLYLEKLRYLIFVYVILGNTSGVIKTKTVKKIL